MKALPETEGLFDYIYYMLKQVFTTIMILEGLLLLIPTLFLDMVGSIGYLVFWMFATAAVNLIFILVLLKSDLERKGNYTVMLAIIPLIPIFLIIMFYGIINK